MQVLDHAAVDGDDPASLGGGLLERGDDPPGVLDLELVTEQIDQASQAILSPEEETESPSESPTESPSESPSE